VLAVKKMCAVKYRISPSSIRLVYDGQPLADDATLVQYGIKGIVHILFVLRGS
jgi:hypothetical protein